MVENAATPENAPCRTQADNAFAAGDHETALEKYSQSLDNREPGRMYTLLNMANLYKLHGQWHLALDNALKAKHVICDFDYFETVVSQILNQLIAVNQIGLLRFFVDNLGLSKNIVCPDDIRIFILGFPRCGTSSLANYLLGALDLISGPGLQTEHLQGIDVTLPPSFLSSKLLQAFSYEHNFCKKATCAGYLDKSTGFSLNKKLLSVLINYFPNSRLMLCVREGYSRSVSAYRMCTNYQGLSFSEAVDQEIAVINRFGGVASIFNDARIFAEMCLDMQALYLNHQIVYPTLVMDEFRALCPEFDPSIFTFFDVDKQELIVDSCRIPLKLERLNRSSSKPTEKAAVDLSREAFLDRLDATTR